MNWLDSYYEAVEFFYWEPQHLGRKKHPEAKLNSVDKVLKRLRRMEVTLNQNLHQFFSLAPARLCSQIFEHAFKESMTGPFDLYGRNVDQLFNLQSAMQPDLLFTSKSEVASIEMKIGAKCSVSQVLKYALLGIAIEQHFNRPLKHGLILLGSGNFENQWQEGFASLAELRSALEAADQRTFMHRQAAHLRGSLDRFLSVVAEMRIAFLNYRELATFLRSAAPHEADESPGAEVYRKLVQGMIDELCLRQLAK